METKDSDELIGWMTTPLLKVFNNPKVRWPLRIFTAVVFTTVVVICGVTGAWALFRLVAIVLALFVFSVCVTTWYQRSTIMTASLSNGQSFLRPSGRSGILQTERDEAPPVRGKARRPLIC